MGTWSTALLADKLSNRNYREILTRAAAQGNPWYKAQPALALLKMSTWGNMGVTSAGLMAGGAAYGGYRGYKREGTVFGALKGGLMGGAMGLGTGIGMSKLSKMQLYKNWITNSDNKVHRLVNTGLDWLERKTSGWF